MTTETACERAARLRGVREKVATGQVIETRFGEDMVRFGAANLALLDREIRKAERECAIEQGQPAKPARHAFRSGGRI